MINNLQKVFIERGITSLSSIIVVGHILVNFSDGFND